MSDATEHPVTRVAVKRFENAPVKNMDRVGITLRQTLDVSYELAILWKYEPASATWLTRLFREGALFSHRDDQEGVAFIHEVLDVADEMATFSDVGTYALLVRTLGLKLATDVRRMFCPGWTHASTAEELGAYECSVGEVHASLGRIDDIDAREVAARVVLGCQNEGRYNEALTLLLEMGTTDKLSSPVAETRLVEELNKTAGHGEVRPETLRLALDFLEEQPRSLETERGIWERIIHDAQLAGDWDGCLRTVGDLAVRIYGLLDDFLDPTDIELDDAEIVVSLILLSTDALMSLWLTSRAARWLKACTSHKTWDCLLNTALGDEIDSVAAVLNIPEGLVFEIPPVGLIQDLISDGRHRAAIYLVLARYTDTVVGDGEWSDGWPNHAEVSGLRIVVRAAMATYNYILARSFFPHVNRLLEIGSTMSLPISRSEDLSALNEISLAVGGAPIVGPRSGWMDFVVRESKVRTDDAT